MTKNNELLPPEKPWLKRWRQRPASFADGYYFGEGTGAVPETGEFEQWLKEYEEYERKLAGMSAEQELGQA